MVSKSSLPSQPLEGSSARNSCILILATDNELSFNSFGGPGYDCLSLEGEYLFTVVEYVPAEEHLGEYISINEIVTVRFFLKNREDIYLGKTDNFVIFNECSSEHLISGKEK